ncbi:MAG: hypothetical protein B7Y25_06225 [Alphaproteobacteria bacterium 16-39-46]|nr:MAG: hypothetical protein B7Y25_06225 [Alphaproteobacteria bacterium 16-39-46]OZA42346.1 MAG: hypothetical protein B7X84_06300 [Alphaproteobacteria bacterium 17-39-52]HQS84510.1 hypothetical protein [Alphaproteobacteria bacterium]HQS94302.1 hypothetical protein [Alphaproteobacteria bacterium]
MNTLQNRTQTTITIGTDHMRKKMGEILDCVNLRGDEFIIERKNNPIAVLLSVQKHKIFTEMARKFLGEMMHNTETSLSQDEIDTLTNLAKHETRKSN